jgi:A/G-specific adenine glycosylase
VQLKELHRVLLNWYKKHGRALPWRTRTDPYAIWLSEIMLQQTRVETVIPYYQRFLKAFPDVITLADAPSDEVMKMWTGLGYYSRARNLQKCAQSVRDSFRGVFPTEFETLLELPGIGDYTASAISSIAGSEPRIALDGNLERILSRWLGVRENPKKEGRLTILSFGQKLAALGSAGDVNQALMDFANQVCLPKHPRCDLCPFANFCSAKATNSVSEIPYRAPKKEKVLLLAHGRIFIANNHLLIHRRPNGAWLAGLWDLPWWLETERSPKGLPKEGRRFTTCAVFRTITHHKIRFEVEAHILGVKTKPKDGFQWLSLAALSDLPLPKPSERALEMALNSLEGRKQI